MRYFRSVLGPLVLMASCALIALSSCNDNDKNNELAYTAVRALLVTVNPDAAVATERSAVLGQETEFDFHLIAPVGTTLSNIRSIPFQQSEYGVPLKGLTVTDIKTEELSDAIHYTVRARALLPSLDMFGNIIPSITTAGYVPLVYRLVAFDGTGEIGVSGSFLAFTDRAQAMSLANYADAAIADPLVNAVGTGFEVDLSATFTNPFAEETKIRWNVSGVTVEGAVFADSSAQSTKLTLPAAGTYTLIFAVQGKTSGASALRFRTIIL